MSTDFKSISMKNLQDAVYILNATLKDRDFHFELDTSRFLMLAHFWNFSYINSTVGYVENEPAGIMLNTTDEMERDAFSFHWSVLPQFRRRGLGGALHQISVGHLRQQNYLRVHCSPKCHIPQEILEKLGYRTKQELLELQCEHPNPKIHSPEFEIRSVEPGQLLSQWIPFHRGIRNWTCRSHFIRHAAPLLKIAAAYQKDRLVAYTLLSCWAGYTLIVDFQFTTLGERVAQQRLSSLLKENYPSMEFRYTTPGERAAHQLLDFLNQMKFPPPYVALFVPKGSDTHHFLESTGFVVRQRFKSMTLELASP